MRVSDGMYDGSSQDKITNPKHEKRTHLFMEETWVGKITTKIVSSYWALVSPNLVTGDARTSIVHNVGRCLESNFIEDSSASKFCLVFVKLSFASPAD